MKTLVLRDSQSSGASELVARVRAFQNDHGEGNVADRDLEKMIDAANEGLLLYCEDDRTLVAACGLMFNHSLALSGRSKSPALLLFVEAGGGAIHADYRAIKLISLLLLLGTLAAYHKVDVETRTYFLVSKEDKPHLGFYVRRAPDDFVNLAIAAAAYRPEAGIEIGKTHHFYEFAPHDPFGASKEHAIEALRFQARRMIETHKRGVPCPELKDDVRVDFDHIYPQLVRWGVAG